MQIKSKERVKNRGEVFTNKKEIVEMIDLLKDKDLSKNILEPACGTGNFLVEILKEKLKIQDEYEAISSLFGTDICSENIETSRKRLKEMLKTKESKNKVDENIFVKNFLELESINGINAKDLFYLIITNPPYQTNTTGHANQATPLYDKFFFKAKSLNPEYISFIIPSRWFSGGWGLDDFREEMKKGNISYLKNYLIKDINIRIYNIITDIKLSNYIKSLGKLPTKKPLITACSKIEYDLSRIKNQYEQIFCFGGDLDAILMKDSEMFCLIEYKSGTKNIDISEESYKRFEVDAFKYKTLKNNAKALGIPFINLIFNDTHFNAKIEYIFEEKEIIVRGTSIEDLSNKVKKEIYSFLN